MRTAFGLFAFLVVSATIAAGAEDKKSAATPDGTYLIVGGERAGEKIPTEILTKGTEAERTIVIKGDKMIAMLPGGKEDPIAVKFDSSKTPAELTTREKKGDKTETTYGIYKLEGDTLTICMVQSEKVTDRPKEFKTTKDSRAILLVLKKKEK